MGKKILFIAVMLVLLCSSWASNAQKILTIEEMFELAETNAKTLKPFATTILQSEENIKQQRNACMPDITIGISADYIGNGHLIDRDFSNVTTIPMPHFGNNASVEITQILYAGGALKAANEIAKLELENAKLALENNRQALRFQLVGQYLDLFELQNVLQVYNENIKQTQYVLENMRSKTNEGITLNNDITRYDLLLAELQLGKKKIENAIAVLNFNITTTIGLDNDIKIIPDSNLLQIVLPQDGKRFWLGQSVSNLELRQLETGIKISEQSIKTENAKRIPNIVFKAADNFNGPILIEVPTINKNFNYWYVGIGVQYNFGELYKSKHSVKSAKLATQRLQEQYADAKEQTELAIYSNYVKYLETYDELQTQTKNVELANQNYEVIYNRYQNDLVLISEMLDASNKKLSAEVQFVNAKISILFNYFKLKFILGKL
ncbi:MAG: TolC family protein [Paludibacteraceae bacterium]